MSIVSGSYVALENQLEDRAVQRHGKFKQGATCSGSDYASTSRTLVNYWPVKVTNVRRLPLVGSLFLLHRTAQNELQKVQKHDNILHAERPHI